MVAPLESHVEQRLLAAELLHRARRDLTRLRLIRGASRRTRRRIVRASAELLLAAALFGGLAAAAAQAQCPSHFVNTIGIPDTGGIARPFFADIDGDGDLDAFVGDELDYLLWSFENVGSAAHPAFAPAVRDPFGQGDVSGLSFLFAPALADIDGDGDLDAFVGDGNGDTYFIENVGTATAPVFAPSIVNPFGLENVGGEAVPRFVDIDGDKDLDALVGNGDGDTIFFRNTGKPKQPEFAPPSTNPFGMTGVDGAAVPSFGDIDGDGDLDAFIGDLAGDIHFLENTGSAKAPAFAAPIANPFGLLNLTTVLEDLGYNAAPHFVDIDGDGDLDAFVGEYRGLSFFFENIGTAAAPQFRPPMTAPFGLVAEYYAGPAFVDIDGDGDFDSFLSDGLEQLFFRNTGSAAAPSFSAEGSDPFGLSHPGDFAELSFVDIDADSDRDAFFASSFFLNSGSAVAPSFAAPVTNPFGLAAGDDTPSFADVDGDGDLDAFVGTNPIQFLQNTGSAAAPAFAAPSSNPFGLSDAGVDGYGSPELVDLEGDGDLDAVAVVSDYLSDYLRWVTVRFENTGTAAAPSFGPPLVTPFGFADEDHASSLSFVDIDGDGDIDAFAGRRPEEAGGFRGNVASGIVYLRNDSLCGIHCPDEPLPVCAQPAKARVRIKLGDSPAEDELLWKWTRGTADKAEFGNPAVGTPLALCLYEEQELAMSAVVPPGGTCDGGDCWKDKKKGYSYKDSSGDNGVVKMKLREGAGKAKIIVRGEGAMLDPPALPLAPAASLTVQLINPRTENACWESTFAPPAKRNDNTGFKDKIP